MNARKTIIGLMATTLTLSSMIALSQETDPAAQFNQAWATAEKADQRLHEHFQTLVTQMNSQMNEINATADPARRAELMAKHHATMAEATRVMHDLGDGAVAGLLTGHMRGSNMAAHHAGMHQTQTDARLAQLESQVNMMQTMMEVMATSNTQ